MDAIGAFAGVDRYEEEKKSCSICRLQYSYKVALISWENMNASKHFVS